MNNIDFNNGVLCGIFFSVVVGIVFTWAVLQASTLHQQREAIRLNLATYDEKGCFIWKVK